MATKRRLLGGRPVKPLGGRAVRPIGGRPVVITGAASGIGRSLARHRSRLGSPVAIADIDEAGLKETAASTGARPASWWARTPTSSTPWRGSPPPTITT